MITDQQHNRRKLCEVADAMGELTLIGRVGVARLEGIAGEDRQIDFMVTRIVDDLVHALDKIDHAIAQAGLGIGLAVIFHADMGVGEV